MSISITNNSPEFLRLNEITIPQSLGGTVFFDGTSVTDSSAIGRVNKSGTVPMFSQIDAASTANPPTISIANTYDASNPANNNFEGQQFISPDVDLDGNISRSPDRVDHHQQGERHYQREHRCRQGVDHRGRPNFVQSYTPGIDNVGGDPATLYQGVTNLTEVDVTKNLDPPLGNNVSVVAAQGGTPVQQAVYNAINNPGTGNILTANNVFISAQYLNIDGTIQSGQPSQLVTIDNVSGPLYNPSIPGWTGTESITDAINAAAAAYQQSLGGPLVAVPTIADADFEQPSVGPVNVMGSYAYDPIGSAWTFAGTAGIAANGSAFTSGNFSAPNGDLQVGLLQKVGSFSQVVTGWTAGAYQITFQARSGPTPRPRSRISRCWWTMWSSTLSPPRAAPTRATQRECSPSRPMPHSITFAGLDTAGGDNTAFIDAIAVQKATVEVVGDAGFEQPGVGSAKVYNSFLYNPTAPPWTFTGQAGISANGTGFTSGNPNAPEGEQVAFLQKNGSFDQTVTGWAPGTYQISFQAAQRLNVENGGQDFEVIVDNTVVGTFKPTGGSYQTFTTAAFDIAAGPHTITFKGLDTATNDNTAFIDAIVVEVASVPIVADAGFEQPTLAARDVRLQPPPRQPAVVVLDDVRYLRKWLRIHDEQSRPPEGSQVAILQEHSSFSQMVPGWAAGTYQISFQAAQRLNVSNGGQDFEVLVDNNIVGTFKPTDGSYQTFTTAPFNVTAGPHTITFQGLDSVSQNQSPPLDNTAFIDAVAVTPVVVQTTLAQYGVFTQDNKLFQLPEHVGDNIAVYYDAPNNQLELAPAQVQGGVAELYGQILNTGTGNINVLDGFGQINVTNNTTYTLVTNTDVHG